MPKSHPPRPLLAACVVFVLAAIVAGTLVWRSEQREREDLRVRAANLASAHAGIIQRNIDHDLAATYALAALVRQGKGTVADFDHVASEMLRYYPGVSELALAPGGVIRNVWPLAGNEKALGLDLFRDTAQSKEALLARDTAKLTLAGPLNLVQGGVGAVGRLPVFLDSPGGKPIFWGFTLVVMRFPDVIEAAELPQLEQRGFANELWRIHPKTGQKQVIAASLSGALIDPVERTLQVPNATWSLSVAPVGGWGGPQRVALEAALGLFVAVLLAYLAKVLLELQAHRRGLEALVDERTAELYLRETELSRAQTVARVGSWASNLVTNEIRGSAEALRILGVGGDRPITYNHFLSMVHPADREAVDSTWRAALKGKPYDLEYRILDGAATRWVHSKAEMTFDANGRISAALGTIQDITERKRDAEAQRENEARYRELFEANPQPMWVFDLETLMFLAVNDAAVEHYGYTREEFGAMSVLDIRPPEEVARLMHRVAAVRKEDVRDTGVWRHRRKDGTLIDVEIRAHTLHFGGRPAQIVHVNDVTDRLQIDLKLRESEARFRSLTEMSSDFYWESDSKHRLTQLSSGATEDAAQALPGTPLGKRRWQVPYLTPDETGWRAHQAVLDAHLPFRDFEFSRMGTDGVARHIAICGDPVFDASGAFQGYRGVGKHISERKAAEARIVRLTQLYAALSQCNQAIVRSTSEHELLQQICSVAVDFGGMKMAWVGFVDPDTRMLRFAARDGDHADEYLQGVEISVDEGSPLGRGPAGIVIRENRPYWCQDLRQQPLTAPWHERRARFGWAALASLPLRKGGAAIGVLSLYAGEVGAFDEAVSELLIEMAANVGFALDNFERESLRQRAEEARNESEARFRCLSEMSSDFFWESDAEHRLTTRGSANQKASTVSVFQQGAHIGERRWDIPYLSPDESGWRAHRATLDAHLPFREFELSRLGVDGAERHISISGDPVFDASGVFKGYRGVGSDVTEGKQAEAHLRLAARVFDHSQEAITITDANANIITVNRRFTEITGYSAEEAIGQNPRILKSGRHSDDFYQAMWQSIHGDGYWNGEIWNRRKDGSVFPEWLSISAVRNEQGQVINYVAVFVDISQRIAAEQALRASEEKFAKAFRSSPLYISISTISDGRYIEVNDAFLRGTGHARAEVIGHTARELGLWKTVRDRQHLIDVLLEHGRVSGLEAELCSKSGEVMVCEIWAEAIVIGDTPCVIWVTNDVTTRKKAELEICQLNAELEQRVTERTRELEMANGELEAFSYSVSHDLRAPLRAIHGFSRLVEQQYASRIDEPGRDMLRRVSAGAERMGLLIDDLLRLSRISRQSMRIGPVDLSALAWEVAGELQAESPGRRVDWVIAPQAPAVGDRGLLRVVMQNLIGNAWKYSSKRELARIEFGVGEKGGRPAYFVRDNGAGFDMAYASKLFEAFQRLHSAAEFSGSGIGLATVSRVVQRHGGEVWAEGRVGEGARFYFSLG